MNQIYRGTSGQINLLRSDRPHCECGTCQKVIMMPMEEWLSLKRNYRNKRIVRIDCKTEGSYSIETGETWKVIGQD